MRMIAGTARSMGIDVLAAGASVDPSAYEVWEGEEAEVEEAGTGAEPEIREAPEV